MMKTFTMAILFPALLLGSAMAYVPLVPHTSSMNVAVNSPLFRAPPQRKFVAVARKKGIKKQLRHTFASLATAALVWKGCAVPEAHALLRKPEVVQVAKAPAKSRTDQCMSALGMVMIATGSGVLLNQAIKTKKEKKKEEEEDDEDDTLSKKDLSDSFRKAQQKNVEKALDRIEKEGNGVDPPATKYISNIPINTQEGTEDISASYVDSLPTVSSPTTPENATVSYLDMLSTDQTASPELTTLLKELEAEPEFNVVKESQVSSSIEFQDAEVESIDSIFVEKAEEWREMTVGELTNSTFEQSPPASELQVVEDDSNDEPPSTTSGSHDPLGPFTSTTALSAMKNKHDAGLDGVHNSLALFATMKKKGATTLSALRNNDKEFGVESIRNTLGPLAANKKKDTTALSAMRKGEDDGVSEKYAAMDSLEERAFAILTDLGMVEIHPDPDSPEYDHSKDQEYVE